MLLGKENFAFKTAAALSQGRRNRKAGVIPSVNPIPIKGWGADYTHNITTHPSLPIFRHSYGPVSRSKQVRLSKVESGRKDIRTVKIRDDDLPTYALIILFSKEHGL